MIKRIWALAALGLAVACAHASAAPTTVQLRVEGETSTTFEGSVTTDGKTLTKDASGPHPCDGTNGGANPTPGPTMTSALDDGSIAGGFTWDGTWFSGFEDFGIDRIGPDATDNAQGKYWGYALNYQGVSVGGCQQKVQAGDEVLFGYDFFSKLHLLKLTGPQRAATGEPATVKVVDGQDNSNIVGASVGGTTTGVDGTATVTYDTPGTRRLKAERADSLRSNALDVCVYTPGSGDCGTDKPPVQQVPTEPGEPGPGPDRTRPLTTVTSIKSGKRYKRGPRELAGRVADESGIFGVYIRLRRFSGGRCTWYSVGRERFLKRPRDCERAHFHRIGNEASWSYLLPRRLGEGRYILDVKAIDRAFNAGRTQVPFSVIR
jgi:hypothetical protein